MATLVDSKYSAAFCILLGSLSVAFSDVVSVNVLDQFIMDLSLVLQRAHLCGIPVVVMKCASYIQITVILHVT